MGCWFCREVQRASIAQAKEQECNTWRMYYATCAGCRAERFFDTSAWSNKIGEMYRGPITSAIALSRITKQRFCQVCESSWMLPNHLPMMSYQDYIRKIRNTQHTFFFLLASIANVQRQPEQLRPSRPHALVPHQPFPNTCHDKRVSC